MKIFKVFSAEYGDLLDKLKEALELSGAEVEREGNGLAVKTEDGGEILARAAAGFLLNDVKLAEMRKAARLYPLSAELRESAVGAAAKSTADEPPAAAERLIMEHLLENELFVPEGFLRFRRPDLLEAWAMETDRAVLDINAQSELEELCGLIGLLSDARRPGTADMRLLLLPDGSSVLSDDSGCRIECDSSDESVLAALIESFRPRSLTVFDLSPEGMPGLRRRIREAFGIFAKVFVGGSDGDNEKN